MKTITDEAAILAAECPLNHAGPHKYDVIPGGKRRRIAGQCRGCGGMISAAEAHEQPAKDRARAEAIAQEARDQRKRAGQG